MGNITAKLVKDLRDKTGAGMMDCKKALSASEGDINKSIEWLRQKGIASAEKKAPNIKATTIIVLIAQKTITSKSPIAVIPSQKYNNLSKNKFISINFLPSLI